MRAGLSRLFFSSWKPLRRAFQDYLKSCNPFPLFRAVFFRGYFHPEPRIAARERKDRKEGQDSSAWQFEAYNVLTGSETRYCQSSSNKMSSYIKAD